MEVLKTPIQSISELKKAPMKIIKETKQNNTATYIFKKSEKVAVLMSVELFEKTMEKEQALKTANKKLEEEILDLKINQIALERLVKTYKLSDEKEVLGEHWQVGLDVIPDDWE
ncbi:MAG: type II toxin-antitoxin system Phd/YefM family antitoxin [Streptococcaceae bacterium]|jgi:PHD/YefM family antitoxin component YafN of YafNO toxin-antitoxin module|nr:type II toxin-antitoxin system Phd/YefM family antitoxin [Streptococcaceae bacterium]